MKTAQIISLTLGTLACTTAWMPASGQSARTHIGSAGSAQQAVAASTVSACMESVFGYEAVINERDSQGNYVAQYEGVASLASRLAPFATEQATGVSGMGAGTPYFGYLPTTIGVTAFAEAVIANQGAAMYADVLANGTGTADWVHTLHRGKVSGNVGYLILDFAVMGSFTDDDGNRLPVEFPLALIDPLAQGSIPLAGRCICACVKVNGQWKVDALYFVQSELDLLYGAE